MDLMEQPMCIVDTDAEGKLSVNTAVLEQLMGLDREVVVVTIAGRYRSGKSYLMNRLAGETRGFPLGATIEAQTKGIWIWVREHPKHSDRYLVLLDTEGLGDVVKWISIHCLKPLDPHVRSRIKRIRTINKQSDLVDRNEAKEGILYQSFVTELSKHILVRSSDGKGFSDENFDFYFPDFVYIIRDLSLQLVLKGREVTADDYLDHCLTMKKGSGSDVQEYNKIRMCIRTYFKKRNCFALVRPKAGFLHNLDTVTDDELDPVFVQEASNFVRLIYEESAVKKINGRKLTGRTFGSLLQIYVEQMRTGVPRVENAVEAMATLENTRAVIEAVHLYEDSMRKAVKMPVLDDAEISRLHNESLQMAIVFFLSKAIFDERQLYQKQMNEQIEDSYQEIMRKNEEVCRTKCIEALNKHYGPIVEKIGRGDFMKRGGFNEYKNDVKLFERSYNLELGALAVKMRHVFLEFIYSRKIDEEAILAADEKVSEAEKAQEEERQRTIEMERQKQEAERAAELQRLMAEDQKRAHEENVKRLEERHAQQRTEDNQRYEQLMKHRLKEQERRLQEGFTQLSNQMQQQMACLQSQIAAASDRGSGFCAIL